jgi:acid phosphatase (class A)
MNPNKYRKCFIALALSALLTMSAQAFAEDQPCSKFDHVPLALLLMPPPSQDSKETRAELAELEDLEASRTPAQEEHARCDHSRTVARFLEEIGIKLDSRPVVAMHFFQCVAKSVEKQVNEAKIAFHRTRPYKLPDSNLHVLKEVAEDDSFSYPSGHAAYGMATGLLLAEMLPENRNEILKRIEDFGYSRLVSGVHFRSDVYAGEMAGAIIVAHLLSSQEFAAQLANAKDDLRKALGR